MARTEKELPAADFAAYIQMSGAKHGPEKERDRKAEEEKEMKKLVAMILAVLMMVGCVSAFAAEGTLTKEEAVKTALEFAGVKEDQVTFLNVHRDLDDGREVFEIKFVANKVEYEMNVDIRTGRVFDADRDYYDWDDFDDRYEDFDEVWDDFFFDFD